MSEIPSHVNTTQQNAEQSHKQVLFHETDKLRIMNASLEVEGMIKMKQSYENENINEKDQGICVDQNRKGLSFLSEQQQQLLSNNHQTLEPSSEMINNQLGKNSQEQIQGQGCFKKQIYLPIVSNSSVQNESQGEQQGKYQLKYQRIEQKRGKKQQQIDISPELVFSEQIQSFQSSHLEESQYSQNIEISQRTATTQAQQGQNSRITMGQMEEVQIISLPLAEQGQRRKSQMIIQVAIKHLSENSPEQNSNSSSSMQSSSSSSESTSSYQDSESESTTTIRVYTQRLPTVMEHPEQSAGSNLQQYFEK